MYIFCLVCFAMCFPRPYTVYDIAYFVLKVPLNTNKPTIQASDGA